MTPRYLAMLYFALRGRTGLALRACLWPTPLSHGSIKGVLHYRLVRGVFEGGKYSGRSREKTRHSFCRVRVGELGESTHS